MDLTHITNFSQREGFLIKHKGRRSYASVLTRLILLGYKWHGSMTNVQMVVSDYPAWRWHYLHVTPSAMHIAGCRAPNDSVKSVLTSTEFLRITRKAVTSAPTGTENPPLDEANNIARDEIQESITGQ
jgi:hypothetical protein